MLEKNEDKSKISRDQFLAQCIPAPQRELPDCLSAACLHRRSGYETMETY